MNLMPHQAVTAVNDKSTLTLALGDGRQLAYGEYGDPGGRPLFYLHGIPGSRQEFPLADATVRELGIRLLVPDRPGYGLSDSQAGRTLLDWPADLAHLADALGLDQFAVLGFSGGGPYALACAHALEERITAVGLISSLAPLDAPGMWDAVSPAFRGTHELAASDPALLEQQLAPAAASPEAVLAMFEEPAPAIDKARFAEPAFRALCLANLTESLRQGAGATAWDLHLVDRPWGFDPARIQRPVQLWHGTEDINAPIAMGDYLAQTLPHCTARFLEGEGHYSILNHMEMILRKLMTG